MTSLAVFLPAWSSILLVTTLAALYATVWLIQIISVETITAAFRLLARGGASLDPGVPSTSCFRLSGGAALLHNARHLHTYNFAYTPSQTSPPCAGHLKVGGFSLRALACNDIALQQPQHLGGHVVFRAKSVSLHPSWQMLKGAQT